MSLAMYQRESPLPPPAELRAYYDIAPGVGDRIMGMAQTAASERRDMHNRIFWFGMFLVGCATAVLLAIVAGAVWIAIEVTAVGGVALGISPIGLIGVTGLFVRGRRRREQDDDS